MSDLKIPKKLSYLLVSDELFDLTLYKRLSLFAKGDTLATLLDLIPVEEKHFAFWQKFFEIKIEKLDFFRCVKLFFIVLFCRIFGEIGIHVTLEAIEIRGVKKYLAVWEIYRDVPLGSAVEGVLVDEFKHEDALISESISKRIRPERIRDIFLGMNDGIVEILGAVSGFFAALQTASTVLAAALTVAVAGAISMAAGAFVAISSESEVSRTEYLKKKFLRESLEVDGKEKPFLSALVVGISYFVGSLFPVLPVFFGARSVAAPLIVAGIMMIVVSYIAAFLSGMDIRRRISINLIIMALAVSVTYIIGLAVKSFLGINV
ncbi:VIT1/CCC1 transporter family protein [Candidatus Giovannonibacteria bacterium]|nr:VIT1/CCC1 transporter family protein [Candidatus Giovannonibacteria bacterium]